MRYYTCHVCADKGYAPFPLERPPAPARKGDVPGCVCYQEKNDGRCRVTGKQCDAEMLDGIPATVGVRS